MKARLKTRRFLLSFGSFLLFFGLIGAFFWFYWLLPWRNTYNWEWHEHHTEKEWWAEIEKRINHIGWTHDDTLDLALYGNKEWFVRLMKDIKPGDDLNMCCGGLSHQLIGLRGMTNQDAGETAEAWLNWWDANRHKTQEQWIREGFAQRGLVLHSPLTKDDIIALLTVLGKIEDYPRYWRHNAYRWLRDSDFVPLSLHASELPAESADAVLAGLVKFSRWVGRSPKEKALGVLDIGEPIDENNQCFCPPKAAMPEFAAMINALIIVLFGGGLASV